MNDKLSITQCKMARAGLNLGIRDVAELADVSPNTVTRFERGEKLQERTIKAIKDALEKKGAEFLDENGVNIRIIHG
ncbi:MAG: helix-turn-helix transcriptional regulator [Alphaproteobacteria bacterium]